MAGSLRNLRSSYYHNSASGNARVHYGDVYNGDVYQAERDIAGEVLASLHFAGMTRHRPLESFSGTYEWVFDGITTNFKQWLEESHDTFWINGKAGAGKSCLMKLLVEHPRTTELLREWANGEVTIAAFFFWAAGDDMERSQLGLMHGVLHEILKQRPDVIEQCMPDRWAAHERRLNYSNPWSPTELQHVLDLVLHDDRMGSPVCLFIDGLDEFDGDLQDLIDFLNTLSRSEKVKLCVSSRPWNAFHTAYGSRDNEWQLKLQDFTKPDMELFITARIEIEPRFQALFRSDQEARDFSSELQLRAEGVFLWVSLAIKTLRRGLGQNNSLPLLHQRLGLLPPELGAMLQHMFDNIEPVYRKLAARSLLILNYCVKHIGASLPILWLAHVDEEVIEPNFALLSSGNHACHADIQHTLDMAEQKVRAWCQDFIEVRRDHSDDHSDLIGTESPTAYIQYGHLSIHEFLNAKERDVRLHLMAGSDFEPALSICRALVLCAEFASSEYRNIVALFLGVSHEVSPAQQSSLVPLAQKLCDSLGTQLGGSGFGWVMYDRPDFSALDEDIHDKAAIMIRAHALVCGQETLFCNLFTSEPHYNTHDARILWLYCALCPGVDPKCTSSELHGLSSPLLGAAMRIYNDDVDVNRPVKCLNRTQPTSLWKSVLRHLNSICSMIAPDDSVLYTLAWLVSCGASANDVADLPALCGHLSKWWIIPDDVKLTICSPSVTETAELRWLEDKPSRVKHDTDFLQQYQPQVQEVLECARAVVASWKNCAVDEAQDDPDGNSQDNNPDGDSQDDPDDNSKLEPHVNDLGLDQLFPLPSVQHATNDVSQHSGPVCYVHPCLIKPLPPLRPRQIYGLSSNIIGQAW